MPTNIRRPFFVFLAFFMIVVSGCSSDSKSTSIAVAKDTQVVVDGESIEVSGERIQVNPTYNQIKLIMCNGVFVFDGESCRRGWAANRPSISRKGKTLQEVIAERYPNSKIMELDRTRESYDKARSGIFTVYYATLAQNE